MMRVWLAFGGVSFVLPTCASAAPRRIAPQQFTSVDAEPPEIVGDPGVRPPVHKAGSDTVWIADWSFDSAGGCTSAGWTQYDNHIGNGFPLGLVLDGHTVWTEDPSFNGEGLIVGNAAKLGIHNLCWEGDGYGNNWDYGIKLNYKGNTTLDFDFKCDSEACCDFVTVEIDEACSSFSKMDYVARPGRQPGDYRSAVSMTYNGGPHGYASGNTGVGTSLHCTCTLTDFGAPNTTHCAYIRFAADGGWSHEDGLVASAFGAALVVDNIALTGGAINYTEDFSGALNPNVTFMNMNPTLPFGMWARVYEHCTDDDKCTENTTCAWLWSDPTLLACHSRWAFGPGMATVRNWLDDIIVGPWVSLAATPGASGTVLSFRRFFGNAFSWGKIAQNWSIRSRSRVPNTDTTDPTDSIDCISPWAHAGNWSTGGWASIWSTSIASMSQYLAPAAREIQLRWRLSDWQYITGDIPPQGCGVGPGPYNDRMRIGRRVLSGPVIDEGIDARSQAQDGFATVPLAGAAGERFAASTDRFGTCAFSESSDLTIGKTGPRVVCGDSISIGVTDARGAGGITSVRWYGAITSGPHAGKAPAPYEVGANGFFAVSGDSVRGTTGAIVAGKFFVDLDDTYFRGGDVLEYFWVATDAGGAFKSDPEGMTALPASRAEAEAATGGLLEVSFLPAINWSPTYLARIAADGHGDLEPTSGELAASHQAHCVLYDELVNFRRLSGQLNRTAMMYTLDRLGYRGAYDSYDQMGYGNTNNQLGGRATVAQATGYALIIQDNGRGLSLTLPDGINIDSEKVDQAQWYRDWLANGSLSAVGAATLWIQSENTVNEKKTNALIATDMGVTLVANDQGLGANPEAAGQATFTWANGGTAAFTSDHFALSGGCPSIRNYDGLGASGTAVITHRYKAGSILGSGAIVMNRNASLRWNTILASFAWFDIRDFTGTTLPTPNPPNPSAEAVFMSKILTGVLPLGCQRAPNPVEVTGGPPRATALYQNVPNPFNPTTTISLDLAQQGQVEIRIFDVTGHIVRTLVEAALPAGRHDVLWNGLDDAGRSVASGVYFYRLQAGDFTATRKLVALR